MPSDLNLWDVPRPSVQHDDISAALPPGTVIPLLPLWPLPAGFSRASPLPLQSHLPRLAPGARNCGLGAGAAALQSHIEESAVLPERDAAARQRGLRDLVWETVQKAYAACGGARLFVLVNEDAARQLQPTAGAVTPIHDQGVFDSLTLQSAEVLLLVHAVRAAPAPHLPAEAAWLAGALERRVGAAEAALPPPLRAGLAGAPILDASYVDLTALRAASASPAAYEAAARAALLDMAEAASKGGADAPHSESALLQWWAPETLAGLRGLLARHCEWREGSAWRGGGGGAGAGSMPLAHWHRRRLQRGGARGLACVVRPTFLALLYPRLAEGLASGALSGRHNVNPVLFEDFPEPGGGGAPGARDLSLGLPAAPPGALPHATPPLLCEYAAGFAGLRASGRGQLGHSYLRPQAQALAAWPGWLWDTLHSSSSSSSEAAAAPGARLALQRRLVRYARAGELLAERQVGLMVVLNTVLRAAAGAGAAPLSALPEAPVRSLAWLLGWHAAAAGSAVTPPALHRLALHDLTHCSGSSVVPRLPPGAPAAEREARFAVLRVSAALALTGIWRTASDGSGGRAGAPWDPLRPLHPHLVAVAGQVRTLGALRAAVRILAVTPLALAEAAAAARASAAPGSPNFWSNAPYPVDPAAVAMLRAHTPLGEGMDLHAEAAEALAGGVTLGIVGALDLSNFFGALPDERVRAIEMHHVAKRHAAAVAAARRPDATPQRRAAVERWLREVGAGDGGGGAGGAGGGGGGRSSSSGSAAAAAAAAAPPPSPPASAPSAPCYATAAALAAACAASASAGGAASAEPLAQQAAALAEGRAAELLAEQRCCVCGETWAQAAARGGELLQCSRCLGQDAIYCGADCQRAAWKAGHKAACVQAEAAVEGVAAEEEV